MGIGKWSRRRDREQSGHQRTESLLTIVRAARDARSHEEEFVERYDWLHSWCLRLTGHDREQAKDLLHDAFVHFSVARPDLSAIGNLEAFFYTLLRNLYLSQMRRFSMRQGRELHVIDLDSLEMVLRGKDKDSRSQSAAQDELIRICEYAVQWKETNKAGCALILRFFQGYYPSEIMRVMKSNRILVDRLLRIGRVEARRHLRTGEHRAVETELGGLQGVHCHGSTDEFLQALRNAILQPANGHCVPHEELRNIYGDEPTGIECSTLAHIVTCAGCLDEVNDLLGLPKLSSRYLEEAVGYHKRPKNKGGNGKPPVSGPPVESLGGLYRGAQEALEHRPDELFVSVNGFVVGTQKVRAELSELSFTINSTEPVAFIQVRSEQDVLLLFLKVEPMPHGAVRQSAGAKLSDGRTLEASMSFAGPWPVVRVAYHDPLFEQLSKDDDDVSAELTEPERPATKLSHVPEWSVQSSRLGGPSRVFRTIFEGLTKTLSVIPGRIPKVLSASVALVLIVALLFYQLRPQVVSAAVLLNQSTAVDESAYRNPKWVLQRSLNLEEVEQPSSRIVARGKIEIWQSGAKGVRVRRLFDENNQLVAGEWTQSDGGRKVYRRHNHKKVDSELDGESGGLLGEESIWQLEPSARGFSALIGRVEFARVTKASDEYVINYEPSDPVVSSQQPTLIRASLTLQKVDLHPIRESLVVRESDGIREYRFSERTFTRWDAGEVSPETFEPDPELLTSEAEELQPRSSLRVGSARSSLAALVGLEVRALYKLDQIGATLTNEVSVKRTGDGHLRIEGIVESERRKTEILDSLRPVVKSGTVTANVQTIREMLEAQSRRGPQRVVEQEVEGTTDTIPLYSELHRYFAEQWDRNPLSVSQNPREEWVVTQIRNLSDRVLNASIESNLHASVLKDLVKRFSPEERSLLTEEERNHYEAMIEEHALAVQENTESLRRELNLIFLKVAVDQSTDGESWSRADEGGNLVQTTARLCDVTSANQERVVAAFTISQREPAAAIAETRELGQRLLVTEELAEKIHHHQE
jgi:DNA-directed RNA polymerase specialized sigma24 family protein